MTSHERIERLADFDIAGLGAEIWNRLLTENREVSKALELWEDALGREHLNWFSATGFALLRDLEQDHRTRFRRSEERIRKDVFHKFVDALEAPQDRPRAARLRPLIRGYGAAVVRLLEQRRERVDVRQAIDALDQALTLEQFSSNPILKENLRVRTRTLDWRVRPGRTSHQLRRVEAIIQDSVELEFRDKDLRERVTHLRNELDATSGKWDPQHLKGLPVLEKIRGLERLLRERAHAGEIARIRDSTGVLRSRLRREFGRDSTDDSGLLISDPLDCMIKPGKEYKPSGSSERST